MGDLPNPMESAEIKEDSLDLLMAKETKALSDDDIKQIIAGFRAKRVDWQAEESSAKTQGRRVNPRKGTSLPKKALEALKGIDLDGLDLDLDL